jgi:ribonuclease P protein component
LRYYHRDERKSSFDEEFAQNQDKARLGISVNKKTGNAVHRNRLKRLAREAFRLNRHSFNSQVDIVLSIQPGCAWQNFEDAKKDFLALCGKAQLLA